MSIFMLYFQAALLVNDEENQLVISAITKKCWREIIK